MKPDTVEALTKFFQEKLGRKRKPRARLRPKPGRNPLRTPGAGKWKKAL